VPTPCDFYRSILRTSADYNSPRLCGGSSGKNRTVWANVSRHVFATWQHPAMRGDYTVANVDVVLCFCLSLIVLSTAYSSCRSFKQLLIIAADMCWKYCWWLLRHTFTGDVTRGFHHYCADSVTQRTATETVSIRQKRREKPITQELAASSLEPCCIFPQVRECRRNCGAVGCVALRNDGNHALFGWFQYQSVNLYSVSQNNGPLQLISHNFTNSQLLITIFGT